MTDWNDLGFEYTETDYMVRCAYRNGQWGKLTATRNKTISLHAAATALQYGQEAFEGLKAIRGVDGKVRVFRMTENAARLSRSCEALFMAQVPEALFCDAILLCLHKNMRWLPPCDTQATLYFRPIVIGTTPRFGVGPGSDFEFIVLASPIGSYFKGGFHSTPFVVTHDVDRSAPLGTGQFKVGGNYAAAFRATEPAHRRGFGTLFLDSKYHKYIDECGAANFFGIKAETGDLHSATYVTPRSKSILPSLTNNSLIRIAADAGMRIERRHVLLAELTEFCECAACGTASVVSPISMIVDEKRGVTYNFGETPGPVCTMLYNSLLDIQYGRTEDRYGWCYIV